MGQAPWLPWLFCSVRARMLRAAWRYPWSSAAAHCGEPAAAGLLDLAAWRSLWAPEAWREMLRGEGSEDDVRALRRHTSRGRPLGSDAFLSKLEHRSGRRLRPLPIGRPKTREDPAATERSR
jgi:putative transposase